MPKKTAAPSSGGADASSSAEEVAGSSEASVPRSYRLRCAVKEGHGHPIYCASFSRHVHEAADGDGGGGTVAASLATCGGPYATIYEVTASSSGGDDPRTIGDGTEGSPAAAAPPLSARQVYRDVDDGETFYTCAFGGRGVGSPAGCSPVGVARDGGHGLVDGPSGVVYFGNEQRMKRPAKRQRQSDANGDGIRSPEAKGTEQQSTFFLPYSATQDGPPLLCLGGTRGIIKVIDTYRRSLFLTLSGHGNDITDLKFSPANEWLLLSSSKDESIRLWNVQRGVNVAVFAGHNGHRGQVLSVSWHLSGTKFATCGMDNLVKLWKVYDDDGGGGGGEGGPGPVEAALTKSFDVVPEEMSCDGSNVAGKRRARQTEKYETAFQQFPYFSTNKAHTNYVDCVQFVGDLILSKCQNNAVVLWKPLFESNGEGERTVYSTHRVPSSIQFLREFTLDHCASWYVRFESPPPRHRILALGNERGEVKVWHVGGGKEEGNGCHPGQAPFCNLTTSGWFNCAADQSTVRMVAFNPHGSHLVAVKDDSTVWMWEGV